MAQRLLKEKYKTAEGAQKRVAFENGVAKSEFARGETAKHYCYRLAFKDGTFRVERFVGVPK